MNSRVVSLSICVLSGHAFLVSFSRGSITVLGLQLLTIHGPDLMALHRGHRIRVHRQHGGAIGVARPALLIRLAVLSQMGGRPQLPPIRIVLIVQIALGGAVVRRIDGLAILGAGVGATPMRQVGSKHEDVAYGRSASPALDIGARGSPTRLQITRDPRVLLDPGGLDASIRPQRNLHPVAAVHHLQSAIGRAHLVDGR